MTAPRIVTLPVPTSPIVSHNWVAYIDEENGPYGWGETEEQAVADLHQMLADDDRADLEPWDS